MLIGRAGTRVGGVSGGCLEGDLVRKAWWRTAHAPAVIAYDSTAHEDTIWQLGLGSNGVVHVMLERLGPGLPDPLAFVRRCLDGRSRGVLATIVRAGPETRLATGQRFVLNELGKSDWPEPIRAAAADCLERDHSRTSVVAVACGDAEVFCEVVRPPVRLVVFGTGFDTVPLVAAGRALGWHVVVAARRPRSIPPRDGLPRSTRLQPRRCRASWPSSRIRTHPGSSRSRLGPAGRARARGPSFSSRTTGFGSSARTWGS